MTASTAAVTCGVGATATTARAANTTAATLQARAHEAEQGAACCACAGGRHAAPVDEDPTTCFKIKEVLGVTMCLKMTKTEKRLGRDYDDADCHYHVRGKFGGDSNEDVDDMNSDTRWVKLTELVTNMRESELAELDVWAGQLQKAARAARKRVRRAQESGE